MTEKSKTVEGLIQGARAVEAIVISIILVGGAYTAAGMSDSFPRSVGWVLLAISTVVLIAELSHWVKILPGIYGYATLNALHTISSGHVTNLPESPVSRSEALLSTILFATITAVALTFVSRKLDRVDRMSLLAFVGFSLWSFVSDKPIFLAGALCCLLLAWGHHRLQGQRRNSISRSIVD